jgi:hypothetical protein
MTYVGETLLDRYGHIDLIPTDIAEKITLLLDKLKTLNVTFLDYHIGNITMDDTQRLRFIDVETMIEDELIPFIRVIDKVTRKTKKNFYENLGEYTRYLKYLQDYLIE